MAFSKEFEEKVIEHLMKISNNKDCEAQVRPSNLGYGTKSDDTEEFKNSLLNLEIVKSANILGKDLISVIIKK